MMRRTELSVLLVRLGLVLGLVLLSIVVLAQFRRPATTAVPSTSQSPPAASPANVTVSNAPRDGENVAQVDAALIQSSGMMIAAPPETPSALQSVDPRQLRAIFQRGTAAMQKYIDDELKVDGSDNKPKIEGARLVNVAASLGYEPARVLIARDYPEIAHHPYGGIGE